MKKLLLTALGLMSIATLSARPLRIAFPGAGSDDLMQPPARVRISQAMFLMDLFKTEDGFRVVSEERAGAIFTIINTGAMDYGTENLCEVFNRFYMNVDVVCNFYPTASKDWRAGGVELEVWTPGGGERATVKYSMYAASCELVELLIRACKLDGETAARFRAFAKEKVRVYDVLYVIPRLRGHYCDNTGETQFKSLLGYLSSARGDRRVDARVVEAAWWAYHDGRAVGLGSHDPNWTMAKVNRLGLAGINAVIGTEEEDAMRNYVSVKKAPKAISDTLIGYAKILSEDSLGRAMSDAIASGDEDDLDLDRDENSDAKDNAKKEAQARGGLKGLAWRDDPAGLKLTLKCAKSSEVLTRRTVAYCLGRYTDKEQVAEPLKQLAGDSDAIVALYAVRSLLDQKLPAPGAAAAARKVIDGKLADAGVTGFDPIQTALSVLAETGDKSDRVRFEAYREDSKMPRREEAVRGLFAKCEPTAAELPLLDDADHHVTVAGFLGFTPSTVKNDAKFADKAYAYANDACQLVADAARVSLETLRPKSGPELTRYRLSFGNPYERRVVIDDCIARKDFAGAAVGCANADAHVRAYALKALLGVDRRRAHDEAMKLAGDPHTFSRFYAAYVLAETATKPDLPVLEKALAKEKNRVAKLYFADAVAVASGQPKPAPLPKVNSMRETGNAVIWQCGLDGSLADRGLFDGYYTCAEPMMKPTEQIKKAHDERKASIFPRPTPIGYPGAIITSAAGADTFWTTLDKQLPPGCIEYVDGLVYGEETMWYGNEGLWGALWSTFCEVAKIDPATIRGDKKKLTENQKLAWADWSTRVLVRAVNEMIDITRDYIGKLRPGIECCTYDGNGCWGATDAYKDLKFDMYGTYIYDGDNRRMYECIRRLKSINPGKPLQWLSFGNIDIGLGGSNFAKPITWDTTMPTHPISRRFEHCYADSMLVWLGGSDTGYFTNFGTSGCGKSCRKHGGGLNNVNVFAGSPRVEDAADAAVEGSYVMFKDAANKAKRDRSEDIDAPSDDDLEGLELEEEGSKDDPIQKQVDAQREKVRRGLLYMMRMTSDTTAILLGLKRQFPGHYESFLLGGGCYSTAGMLLPNFDVFTDAKQPTDLPGLDHFKMAVVSGAKRRMDEQTRVKWIDWLRRNPAVLVVHGGLFSTGIDWPYVDVKRPDGDLRTFWPWEQDVALTNPVKKGDPVRLAVGEGSTRAKALESDKHGATRVVWTDPAFKGMVVFDLTKGREATWSLRKLLVDFYAKNNVKFEINEHPGRIAGQAGPLQVEHLSWHSYTTNAAPRGFELLTGKYNPVVTPRFNCAVTSDDYVAPCLAIHGGVYVMAHDARLKLIEKLPNGVKVEVQGLCHAVTKTGKPAKIEGKALKEITSDPNVWFIDGVNDEGVCTLPPHGGVECINRGGEVDDMPPWRIFRVKEPTVLTITCD